MKIGISHLIASIVLLAGCEKIPGTDAHKIAAAQRTVANALTDPESARFRNVAVRQATNVKGEKFDAVCGEVNGKNRLGGYVGFTRFIAEPATESAVIDPKNTLTEADIVSAEELCRRFRRNQYSTAESMRSACARPDEIIEKISHQAGFDAVWSAHCS